jgi:hypothetical protein
MILKKIHNCNPMNLIFFFNIMILKENSPLLTHHNKIECWSLENVGGRGFDNATIITKAFRGQGPSYN